MDEKLPNRQSIRLKGWDYSSPGWYFVTICVQDMRPVFGAVVKGNMVLNEVGRMVQEMWLAVERFHPEYHLDEFIIMPNHVHGLVRIMGNPDGIRGKPDGLPLRTDGTGLPDFVRRFKSTADVAWRKMTEVSTGSGRRACPDTVRNGKLWQRNYWDVIVRDDEALANIRRYIRNNPRNYEAVRCCGEPCLLGNAELLTLSKVGFLASRGETSPHGQLPTKTGEAIISIESSKRLWMPAWYNEYVLARCDRMVVGHLNPGGMLACILSEKTLDLEITFL